MFASVGQIREKIINNVLCREVVEKDPTPQSFLMLGDAYMSIQEPDRAIEVRQYQQGLHLYTLPAFH